MQNKDEVLFENKHTVVVKSNWGKHQQYTIHLWDGKSFSYVFDDNLVVPEEVI